jgi:hypothetical protein
VTSGGVAIAGGLRVAQRFREDGCLPKRCS